LPCGGARWVMKFKSKIKNHYLCFIAIILALYIVPIFTVHPFVLHLCFILFLHAALAQAFNLVAGFTGYLTLGHVAFFGVGAYTTAALINRAISPYIAMIIGGLVAAALVLIYIPLFRLRGAYFAISSIFISNSLYIIIKQPVLGLGGSVGLTIPIPPIYSKVPYYYVSLSLMIFTIIVAYLIKCSKIGLGMFAIRQNEDAALHFGINTLKLKIMALSVSAIFTGFAGGLYTYYVFYISPETVFSPTLSLQMNFMTIIGGLGTIMGPIMGAFILTSLSEVISYTLGELTPFVYGVSIILIMLFLPEGVWGLLSKLIKKYSI